MFTASPSGLASLFRHHLSFSLPCDTISPYIIERFPEGTMGSEYTMEQISSIVERQRAFFRSGTTLDVGWRLQQLKKLKAALIAGQDQLQDALAADLGRSAAESYLCDIGPAIAEINETIRGLRRWARPELHFSGLMCFPSTFTRVYKMPYGVCLIISPFNFPVLLTVGVLTAAIAGGNTAVIKASSKSAACTAALQQLMAEVFPPEYVTVIDGGHDTADLCLAQRFDKIFYTGSPAVGRHVLASAAENLTPAALELGGETGNWCIIRADADLKDAARKIAFFKLCNAGQICININQVAVASSVAEAFLEELKAAFTAQIGPDALLNPDYPRLISRAAYDKCAALALQHADRVVYGGSGDPDSLRFQPTILWPADPQEDLVRRELFCPLLPVVPFEDRRIDDLLSLIDSREHPLALYLFTRDMAWARRIMQTMQYGGGCVNEVCVHLMVKGVPFGGTGHSGMGAYHGVWGFREFTHPSTVLYGRTFGNLSLRQHPYSGAAGARKLALLKLFER